MPSRNDLSALKAGTKTPILPATDGPKKKPAARRLRTPKPGTVGRPPKGRAEKRSYKIALSLTPAEGQKIAEKAGLAGEATFLYAFLKESGIFD